IARSMINTWGIRNPFFASVFLLIFFVLLPALFCEPSCRNICINGSSRRQHILIQHHLLTVERRTARFPCPEENKHSRDFRGDISEILRPRHRRDPTELLIPHHLSDNRRELPADLLIAVCIRRVEHSHLIFPAPCFHISIHNLRNPLLQMLG